MVEIVCHARMQYAADCRFARRGQTKWCTILSKDKPYDCGQCRKRWQKTLAKSKRQFLQVCVCVWGRRRDGKRGQECKKSQQMVTSTSRRLCVNKFAILKWFFRLWGFGLHSPRAHAPGYKYMCMNCFSIVRRIIFLIWDETCIS